MTPPIPWQPFDLRARQHVDPTIMCLWWLPIRGEHEVFVGRVAYWATADAAVVKRRTGSAVVVRPGAFYAIITAPEAPPQLDDAINVSDSPASSQTPSPRPAVSTAPRGIDRARGGVDTRINGTVGSTVGGAGLGAGAAMSDAKHLRVCDAVNRYFLPDMGVGGCYCKVRRIHLSLARHIETNYPEHHIHTTTRADLVPFAKQHLAMLRFRRQNK